MTVIRRAFERRHMSLAVAAALLAASSGAGAPATTASARRLCPERTKAVFDAPAPTEAGGYVLDNGVYRTFTLADAGTGGPTDINNHGDVTGAYVDTAGVQHGFLIDKRGCFDLVDYPGPPRTLNEAIGINDRRDVVGTWGDYGDQVTNAEAHGYVRSKGRFTSIDVPGALVTAAFKNNDRGQVVGSYSNEARARIGVADAHGFVLSKGRLTRIDAPGAAKTVLFDINDRGQILGAGMNADNTEGFGFLRGSRGRYTRLPTCPGRW
jgi:hypothetical protein